jgi:hypothetical protein
VKLSPLALCHRCFLRLTLKKEILVEGACSNSINCKILKNEILLKFIFSVIPFLAKVLRHTRERERESHRMLINVSWAGLVVVSLDVQIFFHKRRREQALMSSRHCLED